MNEMQDLEHLRSWIGRRESVTATINPWTASAMAATLRNDTKPMQADEDLPPLWHWCYFIEPAAQNDLGEDGHPRRGGFLPPVKLPRRMWAGSQLEFVSPILLGSIATKTSEVINVEHKRGKQGDLVFVKVLHEVRSHDTLLLREKQDIVYCPMQKNTVSLVANNAPSQSAWGVDYQPDASLLFRYSALTFNSHRIHYDFPYVTEVEGYKNLIVHGPLIATLLLEAAVQNNPGLNVLAFGFKAVRPLTCGQKLRVCGQTIDDQGLLMLWAQDDQGALLMSAQAQMRR